MFLISNRQHGEVIEMLTDYLSRESLSDSLRQQNRFRRARLLLKALMKRMPVDKETINNINNKNK